ncbi:MAG: DNA repair protein RadA [Clostridiales bacterium]|nr:DNA repair protein RadA [Clostridiales bacterium]
MKGHKKIYTCEECGHQSTKWLGKCPTCGAWNSFDEEGETIEPASKAGPSVLRRPSKTLPAERQALRYSDLVIPEYMRTSTGMGELDRVLGGGLVTGSAVLLAGEPGIGKSTLLTQICGSLGSGGKRILYVSGEESRSQLKLRAQRIGLGDVDMYVLTECDIGGIISETERIKPDIIIVDSIQAVYSDAVSSAPGSVSQVRETAMLLIETAKSNDNSVIIVGHVNKEGGIAGPKVLEHMVDCVLYFEGDRHSSYRIIRAQKNRFGSVSEIGVFEMEESGLCEIPNPSEMLMADRPKGASGNCAVSIMEGTRPLLAEIQALAAPTTFPSPRRTADGVDYNRLCLILAVLEKRLGLKFSTTDVYMNVVGGLRIDETAIDLGMALALISSYRDLVVPEDLVCIGELGLSGECRAVSDITPRVNEAVKLGFRTIVLPARNVKKLAKIDGVRIVPVSSIYSMLSAKGILIKRSGEDVGAPDFQ